MAARGATYAETLEAFTSFLTAYVHTLLYLRTLYPRTSFVHSRFHNTSVYQSRHPLVCDWIRDAIAAVRKELLDGTVSRIGIVIFSYGSGSKTTGSGGSGGSSGSGSGSKGTDTGTGTGTGDVQIMERFMLDVSAFPVVAKDSHNAVLAWASHSNRSSRSASPNPLSSPSDPLSPAASPDHDPAHEPPAFDLAVDTNLAEQMRAALISLATRCAALRPLPEKCSFNIAMELRDEADVDPPLDHPQAWMPVQPSLQKTGRRRATVEEGEGAATQQSGQDLGGVRVTPIRTVQAGTFRFETWVEEGRAKFGDTAVAGVQAQTRPDVSFAKPTVNLEKSKVSFSTSSGDSSTKS